MKCGICAYAYVRSAEEMLVKNKPLECRRYAPRMICGSGAGWAEWEWPEVYPDDCCGEFILHHRKPLPHPEPNVSP